MKTDEIKNVFVWFGNGSGITHSIKYERRPTCVLVALSITFLF